jgi:hypothetical protein
MARGRMISKSLSTSEKFAALNGGDLSEFSQLLFPLLVAHADNHGRFVGDAFTVKHRCLPLSPRTLAEFEAALTRLCEVQLIERDNDATGKRYLRIVQFEVHQRATSEKLAHIGAKAKVWHRFATNVAPERKEEKERKEPKERKRSKERVPLPLYPLSLEGKGTRPPTRSETQQAEHVLRNRFGRCHHQPRCPTHAACVQRLAAELREKRKAAR